MNTLPNSLRIGVLRGGPSPQYEESLRSGGHVLSHLSGTHQPVDIFISKDGTWHVRGIERSPERILKQVDVVFNALHGAYGEDGTVQEVLERNTVPYTGSNRFGSTLAINKWIAKERAKMLGIKTPISVLVKTGDSLPEKIREIFGMIPYPMIVKPISGGWSYGVHVANSHAELVTALENVLTMFPAAVVEEKISGKEVSCNVAESFRGQNVYVFPAQTLDGSSLSREEKQTLEDVAKQIHFNLGLSHYSESDFIVSSKRGVYFLEVNTLPDISEKSTLMKSLASVGSSMKEFLHHVLGLALK